MDFELVMQLWAKAFATCKIPEAAYNLGVCYGQGHGGPIDSDKARRWYCASRDCDLDGYGHARDAPRGQNRTMMIRLHLWGPKNEFQSSFKTYAAHNAKSVGDKRVGEQSRGVGEECKTS